MLLKQEYMLKTQTMVSFHKVVKLIFWENLQEILESYVLTQELDKVILFQLFMILWFLKLLYMLIQEIKLSMRYIKR